MEHCCIVPQFDDAEIAGVKAPPGYRLLIVPCVDRGWRMGAPDLASRQQLIAADSGLPLADMTCALVDNSTGTVVGVINADMAHPAHQVPGHTLVNHPAPMVGDKWDGTKLSRRFVGVSSTRRVVTQTTVAIDSIVSTKTITSQLNATLASVPNNLAGWQANPTAALNSTVTMEDGSWIDSTV